MLDLSMNLKSLNSLLRCNTGEAAYLDILMRLNARSIWRAWLEDQLQGMDSWLPEGPPAD